RGAGALGEGGDEARKISGHFFEKTLSISPAEDTEKLTELSRLVLSFGRTPAQIEVVDFLIYFRSHCGR
ncbi:MAG: hypothetical protein EBU32_13285, partial [Opitutaceae bacterium]|nr:hypothetical protein [Opitutaceae bacterium]